MFQGNDDDTVIGAKKYSLSFLTNGNDKEIKPADYFITDIKAYKSELPVYPTIHNL